MSDGKHLMERVTMRQLLFLGTILRLVLLVYAAFHDRMFRVKYTDIDYMIVVDGARLMFHGGSPFDRTTYRYTPLLAAVVSPALIANLLGKLVFALSDIGAAAYAYQILRNYANKESAKLMVSIFILFNPIVLNVSTRGNSDMLITFMSMVVISQFSRGRYFAAATVLGFAVHFKIYPIIYALPLVLGVFEKTEASSLMRRLLKAVPVAFLCGVCAVIGFAVPTYLCYCMYGRQYLDEAFLYHIHREDHRHNFSPYWLLMYLNMGRRALGVGVEHSAGLFAFVPQVIVLFYSSFRLRRNVAHACCIETVLFVAFNKVCTVQYFVWFLPFLAFVFCRPKDKTRTDTPSVLSIVVGMTLWSLTIPLWVATAVPLEFQGKNHFGRLWSVSCVFYLATVGLAAWLGRICRRSQDQEALQVLSKKTT